MKTVKELESNAENDKHENTGIYMERTCMEEFCLLKGLFSGLKNQEADIVDKEYLIEN